MALQATFEVSHLKSKHMSETSRSSKKILVADDSLTIQKVIRLALSNEGYDIQAVSDGTDAVQQISLFRPDVVLIDVALPGKSAFEVKQEVNTHEDLAEVRFVLMSSAFEKVDEDLAREVTFHGRLTKPFDPAHLRQVLQEVLAQVRAKRMEATSLIQKPAAGSRPSTPAPVAPPPSEIEGFGTDLWTEAPASQAVAPPPLPLTPPPSTPSGGNEDSDIRELTESTIRISGLDDFQWSVQEPSLKAPEPLTQPDSTLPSFEVDAPLGGGSSMTFEPSSPSFDSMPPMIDPPTQQTHVPPALSKHELDSLVQKEIESQIRQLVERLLPEVTERIVKEEIHRLLSE